MEPVFRHGQGPKVFISYSFGNPLAPRLADDLTAVGYRVCIVDDTMLLGAPTLKSALAELVREAEVLLPVLDAKANRSKWVCVELELGLAHRRPIIPIVQDETELSPLVAGIAYLLERSAEPSAACLQALRQAVEAFYLEVPLDDRAPFLFDEEVILGYMANEKRSRPLIRLIIDPFGRFPRMLDSLQGHAARLLPPDPSRQAGADLTEPIEMCVRRVDRLQDLLGDYRDAMRVALGSYGPDMSLRSLSAWQRLIRLVVGPPLLALAERWPRELLVELLGDPGAALAAAHDEAAAFRDDNSVGNDAGFTWAMQYRSPRPKGPYSPAPGKGGWFWCGFRADRGPRMGFVGFLPACERIADGVKYAQRPATYVEPCEWADYGLPQLFARGVMLADRFGDPRHTTDLVYQLRHYNSSYYPS
jgi:hypothetical protein